MRHLAVEHVYHAIERQTETDPETGFEPDVGLYKETTPGDVDDGDVGSGQDARAQGRQTCGRVSRCPPAVVRGVPADTVGRVAIMTRSRRAPATPCAR